MVASSKIWRRARRSDGRTIFRYRSAHLGDDLEVTVVPPASAAGRLAPVLFVLDPFLMPETVVGWSRVYGRYSGRLFQKGAIPAGRRNELLCGFVPMTNRRSSIYIF